MAVTLHHADAVTWAREYSGEPFHALLCDPPYHLTSIVKRFGKGNSAPAQFGKDGAFARASRGFMGKQWDGGDVAFDPETWEAFKRVMYPGAFGMAFASSRGWHRLACAIEDAGFVIHPSLFGWSMGSGFPKATRVKGADCFDGHRYGLQALKPALEPVIVFQKPYEGRPVDNITATGAGSLWIDGARIKGGAIENHKTPGRSQGHGSDIYFYKDDKERNPVQVERAESGENPRYDSNGRWPSNFFIDAEAARRLDEQSGVTTNTRHMSYKRSGGEFVNGIPSQPEKDWFVSETGGASRFFFRVAEQIDEADPVRYVAKASRRERDAGLEGFEVQTRYEHEGRNGVNNSETYYDPRNGKTYEFKKPQARNVHPCVKPLSLCKYLATLLLPPAEYAPRRIFIPFAGSGSEAIGAMQAGWEEVEAVELTEEYIPIGRARVEYWQEQAAQAQMVMPL